MLRSRVRFLLPLFALSGLAVIQYVACSPRPASDRTRNLRANPPRVRSLDLQVLDPRTVRLTVDYAPDPRLGERLTLHLAQGPVTFLRREDGRYAGDVVLGAEQRQALVERERRIAELGDEAVHFIHDERIAVGSVVVAPLNLSAVLSPPPQLETSGSTVSISAAYLAVGALTPDPMSILMITDRKVVADPGRTWDPCDPNAGTKNGKWTFGYLMKNLAGSADAAKLTEDWLAHWSAKQSVNGMEVKPRPRIAEVLNNWPRSGTSLDLDQAPFRLLAVVNRVDLAENLVYPATADDEGSAGSAGELRFVFDVAPQRTVGESKVCAVMRFQVIFEYKVAATTCADVAAWANRWISLGGWPRGSPDFNLALEGITEDVISGKKGHLAQIRTNEIDLAEVKPGQTLWEMREFELASAALRQRTVRRTPPDHLNGSEELSMWVNAHQTEVRSAVHELDVSLAGVNPQMSQSTLWDGARGVGKVAITDAEARRSFSRNTCTGCHARETCTMFNHVIPNAPGKEAGLSLFLTGGGNVPDPVSCEIKSCTTAPASYCPKPTPGSTSPPNFCCSEPSDLDRRRQFLDQLRQCDLPNGFVALNATH